MSDTVLIKADLKDHYLNLFKRYREKLFSQSPSFINEIRDTAISSFIECGFPGRKAENYKYTNVEEIFNKDLPYSFTPPRFDVELEEMFRCDVPELDTYVIPVINGFYAGKDKPLTKLENGIIYGSLAAASHDYPELFRKHYSKYADFTRNGITALNTSFASDGVFLFIPDNVTEEKPFQIIHLLISIEPLMTQHRNLFIFGDHSRARILICDHTLSTAEFLTNSVTELYAGQGSEISYARVQNEHDRSGHLSSTYMHQMRDSHIRTSCITLHGGMMRNNIFVDLEESGAVNECTGLFITDKMQHTDNYVHVNHKKPDCSSNQLFKGILDHQATGAFTGKIHVWPDAQHTRAYQKNNNLLLTDTAKMHTRPQLEIYADDVKCSHGATIGQLDQDALFYLRSRGIPEKESLHLLMYAFTDDVIKEIRLPALRDRITELVDKRLRGELSRCNDCKMKCR